MSLVNTLSPPTCSLFGTKSESCQVPRHFFMPGHARFNCVAHARFACRGMLAFRTPRVGSAYSGGAENGATAKARVLKGRKDRRDLREHAPLKGAWAGADAILWAELRDVLERVDDEPSEKEAHQEDRAPEPERVQVEEHSEKQSEHSDALQTAHRPVSLCRYLANIAEAAAESIIGKYAQVRADGQALDEASGTLLAGRTPRARRAPRGRDE